MAIAPVETRYTPQQYLARERQAEVRSEYVEGEIVERAGASFLHNVIAANLLGELRTCLRQQSGHAFMSDMRVRVGSASLYTYPDLVVVKDQPIFEDQKFDTLLNPTLIIEVLSDSTEANDRGEKFARYRQLDSLRQYTLVAQNRVRVEVYSRRGQEWVLTECSGIEDVVRLDSIGCEVPMREIYAKTGQNLATK